MKRWPRKIRIGIDVDGPCAAMIEAFVGYANEQRLPYVITRDMVKFHNDMGASPELKEIDAYLRERYPEPGPNGGLGGLFLEFMRNPTVYSDFIKPVEGAQDAIEILRSRADCLFITALMKRANQHVPNKLDWIGRHFPGVSISTVPSEYKCWVKPDFGIDDRWDTTKRWLDEGVHGLLYETPWSEQPKVMPGHDWTSIIRTVEAVLDRSET